MQYYLKFGQICNKNCLDMRYIFIMKQICVESDFKYSALKNYTNASRSQPCLL